MNRLECQVTSCQHYRDNLCCLPGIKVDGPAARSSSQTCCDSYEERRRGAGENAVGCGCGATAESSIKCSAEHCAYNSNNKCEAERVCVGCTGSEATSKSGTECCTFKAE